MVRPWERRSQLLHQHLALWLLLCAVASWRDPSRAVAAAAASPVEAARAAESLAGGIRLGRRQAATATTTPPPAPAALLPSGWVLVGEKPKPTATGAAPPAQATPSLSGGEDAGRDPGRPAPPAASPAPPGTVSVEAGKKSSAQNAVASPRAEGGVLSPIQYRPLALVLSMPFAVAGLGMNLVLLFLVLRGSAAVSYESRKAIQAARMAKGGLA